MKFTRGFFKESWKRK